MDNLDILFTAPVLALQLVANGLLIGAIFAMAAYGMALVWGVMNLINIAQGEFVVLGGFVAVSLADAGVHPLFGVPLAAVALYAVGWLLYRSVVFRVVEKDLFTSLLATFGISILMQQLMNQIFGADIRTARSGLDSWTFFGDIVTIDKIKVIGAVIAVLLGVALVLFLRISRMGQAIRATAQNARAARIMGVDTDRVYATTFSLNAAICGAAGALIAMIWVIQPFIGLIYTIRSFMIVTVAGFGNLAGVVLAALGLGVAENFAGFLLGVEFQIGFVFGLLVVILLARNQVLARQRRYLK